MARPLTESVQIHRRLLLGEASNLTWLLWGLKEPRIHLTANGKDAQTLSKPCRRLH